MGIVDVFLGLVVVALSVAFTVLICVFAYAAVREMLKGHMFD